jgi:hypothetical protein
LHDECMLIACLIRYENAGWPCAEYAVARMNKNIANGEYEPVRRVEAVCMLLACCLHADGMLMAC